MKTHLKALVLLFLCSFTANAKVHILISIDDFSWLATHIVAVTEGDEIDGRVTILESWQGDLNPGDSLNISELARFKSEQSRHIECFNMTNSLGKCPDTIPEFVSGNKIILFLRKKVSQSRPEKWSTIGAVWIEQDRVYGLCDFNEAWEGTLTPYGSEGSVRDTVAQVAYEREALRTALEIKDVGARIRALQPLAESSLDYTARVASVVINALTRAAAQAPKSQKHRPLDLPAVKCGDDCAGGILAVLLQRELEFWKESAPKLKVGWYNDPEMSWEELKVYRTHLSNTEVALGALQTAGHTQSAHMVKELRAFFLSLPQLKDQSLVLKACDSFLNSI